MSKSRADGRMCVSVGERVSVNVCVCKSETKR